MGVDIKIPIGLMFALLGILLTVFGLVTGSDTEMYKMSLDININLWTGLPMTIFGVFMLLASRMSRKKAAKEPAAEA